MTKNEIYGALILAHFDVEEGLVPCPTSSYKKEGLIITLLPEQMQEFFLILDMLNARTFGQHLFCIGKTWCKWRKEEE